jgi:signal transduction histidine kinase
MHRFPRWLRARPWLVDAVLAAVAAGLGLLDGVLLSRTGGWPFAALPLLFAVALLLRSRRMVTGAYTVAALAAACLAVLPLPSAAGMFAAFATVYTAAAYAPRGHARAVLCLFLGGAAFAGLRGAGIVAHVLHGYTDVSSRSGGRDWWTVAAVVAAACAAAVAVAWLWGTVVQVRQAYLRAVLDRAAHLESEREALDRVAMAAERARIAREMHDVIAHSLSVVVLQSDGAATVLDTDRDRARAALADIGRTSRQALAEMRRLLGVLHEPDGPAADRAPQPGLARLPDLVARVRSAGLPVTLDVAVEPAEVPAALGLSAYRIVQEALTNALRHAGPAANATVSVRRIPGYLHVGVADDGTGPPPGGGRGHGLVGMRERAAAVGGTVDAGPGPDGGFRVMATLPVPPQVAGAAR